MLIYRVQCMIIYANIYDSILKNSVDINKLCKISTRRRLKKSNTQCISTCNIRNTGLNLIPSV